MLGSVWRTVAPYESIQRTRNRPRPGTGAPATRMGSLKQTAITIGFSLSRQSINSVFFPGVSWSAFVYMILMLGSGDPGGATHLY